MKKGGFLADNEINIMKDYYKIEDLVAMNMIETYFQAAVANKIKLSSHWRKSKAANKNYVYPLKDFSR